MTQSVRIAIDAMGGDHGPEVILPGAALALAQHSNLQFSFFGDQARLKPLLAADPRLAAVSSLQHTDVEIRRTTSRARRCAPAAARLPCGRRSKR